MTTVEVAMCDLGEGDFMEWQGETRRAVWRGVILRGVWQYAMLLFELRRIVVSC